jgi:periplasmic protein TonB
MIARALPWFEDDNPRDLARWSLAAAVVLCVHAAAIASYLLWWHAPDADLGDDTPIISIELTAPEIDQQEQAKVDEPTPPKETSTDAVLPVEKPPEKVDQTSPAPRTTVRTEASAPRVDPSWQSLLLKHLQQFKSYPSGARQRSEQGVVLLAFSIDRDGHVLSRRIVSSSGFADLDAEVLALVERAQPMPAFPPSMTEAQLDLTVPIRFSLR